MFTGLIDHYGKLLAIENLADSKKFLIGCKYVDLRPGESVAVNGACLTVTSCKDQQFTVDLSPETLAITHASQLKVGQYVNLERPLRLTDRLHGHFVLGHIDQTCHIANQVKHADYVIYTVKGVSALNQNFVVPKGSITVNGVSLTLNGIDQDCFSILLIPETLRKTNLAFLEINDIVNVEYDYLAKIVHSQTISQSYER